MVSCSSMKQIFSLILRLILVISSSSIFAEDIEIFSGEVPPSEPNILFVLDQSGSMNLPIGTLGETRLSSLQNAFNAVVSDPEIVGLKVGLMGFSNGVDKKPLPHGVSFPVAPIDDEALPILTANMLPETLNTDTNRGYFSLADDNLPDPIAGQTVREFLPQILSSWTAYGSTPVVDAYYEAALYFRGETPLWGAASADQNHAAHPATYQGSILAEVSTTLTGYSPRCGDASCGINCVPITYSSVCPIGETLCHLGTNCTTRAVTYNYRCSLGTEAECLALDPAYSSCAARTGTSCTKTCDGETHPESGACLGTETESCTTTTTIYCQKDIERTYCDRASYQCDAVKETLVDNVEATYTSPITNKCQNNAIVLLSDGQPFVDNDAETDNTRALVKTMLGTTVDCSAVPGQVLPETIDNSLADGRCGTELAGFLSSQDQNANVDGDNTVQTYTVGFGIADNPEAAVYLQSLANSGNGKYFPASNTAALVAAFKAIINDIDASARSFAAPVYTVDPNSMLSHSDDIYLPLFENSSLPAWAGNIKKFKLNTEGKIVDANGIEAIDVKGVLKPSAVDFWADNSISRIPATNPVTGGGAANNLNPASRTLLTDNGSALVVLDGDNISKTQLGNAAMSDEYKAQLLSYIQGYQSDGATPRKAMGDILHSKPTVISYGDKQVLFFGTNEGYLHAINAADRDVTSPENGGGQEIFAYMPSTLLGNIDGMLKNTELTGSIKRIYGVDGPITAWILDENKNGKVDVSDGDEAYLFFGLRRGGSGYYALNVTNPASPRLAWKITSSGRFSQLGETWSKPAMGKLRYVKSGAVQFDHVLVFGGGYDSRLDDAALAGSGTPLPDIKGNGIYIVNAKTGSLIWSHEGGSLKDSVPGNIRILDLDRNGSIDRLYFGDTGGNIWRADLNVDDVDSDVSLHDVSNDARISQFASLGGSGANARKFFYEPDVSLFKHGGKSTLLVSLGSGYRPHPLNESIDDRFYVLNDENVYGVPTTPPPALTESDLVESTTLNGNDFTPTYQGWYKKLVNGRGEKVLASSITFNNKVVFTTFANTDSTASTGAGACTSLTSNQTRAYVLDLMTAAPIADLDRDGTVKATDESILISHGDILDSPQLVFNAPSDCTQDGCDQYVDIRVGKSLLPLVDKNTEGGNVNLGDFLPKVFWIKK